MTEPMIKPGMDPFGELVLTVRGDTAATAPDYELPLMCSLDQANEALGLSPEDGERHAREGSYPAKVLNLDGVFKVSTDPLIRAAGLDRVRDVLRRR
ncbi:hypothetical protein [Kitasatospora sp. NPDC094011]|uniref:hypothetical protein n=1 Tax=Kitasatospora sp. NPDC094011 TaxID=3364090 RepID=UPI00381771B1